MTATEPTTTFIPLTHPSPSPTPFFFYLEHQLLFEKFSLLFEYPTTNPFPQVEEMERILPSVAPQVLPFLQHFKERIGTLNLTQIQEHYSDLIDMNPHFHPYVAAHLIGESYKRSIFLVKLRELFREQQHEPPSNELPDHLAVLLRFVSILKDHEIAKSILADLILPALHQIVKDENFSIENALMGTNPNQNPYVYLYMALKEFIMGLVEIKR